MVLVAFVQRKKVKGEIVEVVIGVRLYECV